MAKCPCKLIGKVLLLSSHFTVMSSSRCYTDLSDWITIYVARKRTSTQSILLMKNTTEHQVPKSIHIRHKMEHSYVKNWKLLPMLLVSKKSFPNSWTLGRNTAIKKAVTWGRGEQEGWDSLNSQWVKLWFFIWVSRKFSKEENNKTTKK